MPWNWNNFKRFQELKLHESIKDYLKRGGIIQMIRTETYEPLEWPYRSKGRQMPGEPMGCLKIPGYGV